MTTPISLTDYYNRLMAHDWFYREHKGSRPEAFYEGLTERNRLAAIACRSEAHAALFGRMVAYHVSGYGFEPERPVEEVTA